METRTLMTDLLNLKFSFAFDNTRIISYVKSILATSKDIQLVKFYFANKHKNNEAIRANM